MSWEKIKLFGPRYFSIDPPIKKMTGRKAVINDLLKNGNLSNSERLILIEEEIELGITINNK